MKEQTDKTLEELERIVLVLEELAYEVSTFKLTLWRGAVTQDQIKLVTIELLN